MLRTIYAIELKNLIAIVKNSNCKIVKYRLILNQGK